MELTSMFLNQLTGKSNINTLSQSTNNKGFDQALTKAKTKFDDNNYTQECNKKYDNSKNLDKKVKNTSAYDEKNVTQNSFSKDSDKKVEKNDFTNKEDLASEEKAIIVDNETLQKLSEVLEISPEKIMDILSNLSVSVSMLQQPENLVQFLQEVFNVQEPAKLLAIDNIKDIMYKITDISKSVNYQDFVSLNENFKDMLNSIMNDNNHKQFNVLSGSEDVKQKIEQLLKQLNGKVIEEKASVNIDENNLNKSIKDVTTQEGLIKDGNEISEDNNIPKVTDFDHKAFNNQQNNQNFNSQGRFFQEDIRQDANMLKENFAISGVNNNDKVFNVSLPKTQAFKNINTTDIVNQIMDKIKVSIKQDVSEIKMLLKPEQLGEVSLKIVTQNGIVTAQFMAESQKVKEIIQSNFNQLRDMLSEQGIDVGALEVNVSTSDSEQPQYNMFEQQNKTISKLDTGLEEAIEIDNKTIVSQEQVLNSQVNYSI